MRFKHSRPARPALAVLLACLFFPLTASIGATPASNWVATDTTAFNLNLIPNATDLGPASLSTPLQLLVSLQLQNTSVMYGYFQHITTPGDSLYGHYLSTSEFNAMYSPSMSQAEQVIGYLHAAGFTDITLSDNRTFIRMNGTVGLAQSAFSTQLHQMQYNGQSVLVNTLPALVPAALGNLVLSIIGLDTVPKMHFNHPIKAGTTAPAVGVPGAGSLSGYSPQNFQSIYDADLTVDRNADPSNPQSDTELNDGRNTIIAIIAEGDLTSVVSDLAIFESNNNLPVVTPIVIKTAPPALITDTSGADEFDLDTQSSTGIANNVKNLYVYDAPSLADVEIIYELNQFVSDNFAPAASFSVGGCETLFISELSALDQVFVQMAIHGQTLFASTGDSGASCFNPAGNGVPAGVPGVEYPASSPYVVGAGGTTLTEQAGTNPAPYNEAYDLEVAWYSGGGGTSIFEVAPSWQIPVLPTGAVTSTNTPRGVPDIAMDADANTPANVIVNGASEGVGGTSLASPLSLGAWARMQSVRGNNLGYAPPDLYALDSGPLTPASGFHDIIAGDNVGYAATPGWDYTTGLGSFDIAEITPLLQATPVTITPNPVVNTGNVCTTPGLLLAKNTVSGLDTPTPGYNPKALYVAEVYSPNTPEADALTFTLDVDMIGPSNLYLVYFSTSDGVQHYLAYESTTDGTTPFTYGHITFSTDPTGTGLASMIVFNQDGVLDSASKADTTNNVIVYVLPKAGMGVSLINGTVSPDNTLTRIYGEAGMEVGFLDTGIEQYDTVGVGTVYDTPQSSYTPIGNSSCATGTPVITGGTTTGGTTSGTTGGASTGGTTGGTSTGGTTGGTSTGGTTGGTSTGGTSGGSTGGTSGGTSGGTTIGGAYCTLPGVTLESSSTGSGTTVPYLDIIGLDVAEPYPSATPFPTASAPSTSLTFTITLSSLLSSPVPPPDTEWSTVWVMPKASSTDKISHQIFVSFDTVNGDLMGTISYGYVDTTVTPHLYETECSFGLSTATITPNTCPVTGTYNATAGTITLTLDTSEAVPFTTVATGSTYSPFAINFNTSTLPVLTGVLAQTQVLVGAAGTGLLETTSTTGSATYQLNGNYACMSVGGTSSGGTSGGSTGGSSGGTSTGGTSGGSSTGGTSGGSSTGGTSGGGTSGGTSTGGTSGGSSTGGTSGGASTGGTSGGASTGGTSGGSSTGGTSGGSSTGGTSGGTSTGGASGGASTGGTSGGTSTGGSSTGGTLGGMTAGGTSGGTSTGGTSTGGESSTGGSSGGSTGGTGSDGGSSTGGTGANGDTTGGMTGTSTTVGTSGNGSTGYHGFFGGSFGEALVPLALLAGVRRRRKTLARKRA